MEKDNRSYIVTSEGERIYEQIKSKKTILK